MSFSKMKEHKAGKEKGCGISVPRMVLILQIDCVIPSCNNFTSTTLMQSLFPCCLGYISVQTWNPQCFPQPTTVYAESGPPSGKKFPVSPVLLPTRITWDIQGLCICLIITQLKKVGSRKPKITLQVSDIMERYSEILFSQALTTAKPHHFNTVEVSCYVSSQLHCGNFELYHYLPLERNLQEHTGPVCQYSK